MPTKKRTVAAFISCVFFAVSLYADGVVKNLKDYEYRADGKPWKCTVTDAQTGRLKGKLYYASDGSVEKVEKFDLEGNKIETALYDTLGALRPGPDGWAAMRWWYKESVLRMQMSYDEDGAPIERLFYSEGGKLLMRLYRNDDSNNPNINAVMFSILGSNNVPYYNPKESYRETSRLASE